MTKQLLLAISSALIITACEPAKENVGRSGEKNQSPPIVGAKLAQDELKSGPLGFAKGMTIDQVKKLGDFESKEKKFFFSSKKIKYGHDDFELYSILLTPDHGLCKISAVSKDIVTSIYGTELLSKYNEINDALSKKYGSPNNTFKDLADGSIWNESKDWMMALLKKERSLATFWDKSANKLPDNLNAVALQGKASSTGIGFLVLSYEFDNIDDCLRVVDDKANSNL